MARLVARRSPPAPPQEQGGSLAQRLRRRLSTLNAVHRTSVFALFGWTAIHIVGALLNLDSVASWPLFALTLTLVTLGNALALLPLVGVPGLPNSRVAPLAAAALLPVSQVVGLMAIEPGAITTYANVAPDGAVPVVVALVVTGNLVAASAGVAAMVGVEVWWALAHEPRISWPWIFAVSITPFIFLLGSWTVRRILDRTNQLIASLEGRSAVDATVTADRAQWRTVRQHRMHELRLDVMPFLSWVAIRGEVSDSDRQRAAALAVRVRDTLTARAILDADVKAAVLTARHRGVKVALSTINAGDQLASALSPLLPRLLTLPGLASLTLRDAADPPSATIQLVGPVDPRRVSEAVRQTDEAAPLTDVTDAGGDLIVVSVRHGRTGWAQQGSNL